MADSAESLDDFSAAVLTAAVRLAFSLVACFLLFYVGRRPMAITSGVLSGAAAIALGFAVHIKEHHQGPPSPSHAYAVATCVLLYIAANTSGFFVLPIVTIGELLPARVRGAAGGYIFFVFNIVLFAASKVFPYVTQQIGMSGVFWMFGCFSMIGTLLVWLVMPETKGRSLDEVEDYFSEDNFLWVTRVKHQTHV